jgi:hypothetical protein
VFVDAIALMHRSSAVYGPGGWVHPY